MHLCTCRACMFEAYGAAQFILRVWRCVLLSYTTLWPVLHIPCRMTCELVFSCWGYVLPVRTQLSPSLYLGLNHCQYEGLFLCTEKPCHSLSEIMAADRQIVSEVNKDAVYNCHESTVMWAHSLSADISTSALSRSRWKKLGSLCNQDAPKHERLVSSV